MLCLPWENIWPGSSWKALGVLQEYSVDACLLLAVKSLYSCSEFVSMSGELNHDCTLLVLDSDKGVFCHTPFGSLQYELDRQSQPSRQGCHSWELQDQPFTFCIGFGTASIFVTVLSMYSIHFLLRATKPEWKSALKILMYYVCLQTQGSRCCLWAAIHCNKYLQVTKGAVRRLIHGLVKIRQFCMSFIALWSQNRSFQTPQSCQFLNRSLFQSLPIVMNLG